MQMKYISDMGILAEIAYSDYGDDEFIRKGGIIRTNEDGALFLSTSYTVIDYLDSYTGMQ